MTPSRIAIIQARMSSSRLPGKVLADIAGKPLLQHMLERVRQASSLDEVVVATTIDPSDDILVRFCRKQAISCFRGSLTDVLDRCYQSAAQFHADTIIRLTADCPLIDPGVLDLTVAAFQGNNSPANQPVHFAANRLPPPWQRTLPIGLDVEVCSFAALQRAWKEANQPYQREHVMPYLYEGVVIQEFTPSPGQEWFIQSGETPRGFKVSLLNHSPDFGFLRWTVDTPADLEFVRQVFSRFDGLVGFTWQDVLALLEKEPDLASINADVKHKTAFDVDQRSLGH